MKRTMLKPNVWSYTISRPIGECRYLKTVTTDAASGRTYITSKKIIVLKKKNQQSFHEVM